MEKNKKSGKLEMCVDQGKKNELRKNLFKSYAFQCRVREKRSQARVFEYEMKDKSLSVLHFDFALAFSAEYWNEVQSVLWFRAYIDIFTALFYNNPWKNAVNVPGVAETHHMMCSKDDDVKLFVDDLNTNLIV